MALACTAASCAGLFLQYFKLAFIAFQILIELLYFKLAFIAFQICVNILS